MKTRNGFVSNSSSSSFILKTDADIIFVKDCNISTYKVSDLIIKFKPIIEAIKTIKKFKEEYDWDSKDIPYFLLEEFEYMNFEINELIQLEKENPGCYITGAYDRDAAYRQHFYFDVFKGDM